MVELNFEIGGKEIHLYQIKNENEKATLQKIANELTESLNFVRCPEHNQLPKITIRGETTDDLYFEVKGCCSSLLEESLNKIDEIL